jgi:formylglycine-generating enzyme
MKLIVSLVFSILACVVISCGGISAPPNTHDNQESRIITLTEADVIKSLNCPPEMVEIEGNYCPVVEETCLEWDETVVNVNGKVRCMRFAPTKCLAEKRIHLHYCMDKFEYQKDKNDPLPTVMVSFNQMQVLAAKEDKRLCYDYEWEFASAGEEMRPYATGWTREPGKCNIDKPAIAFDERKLGSSDPKIRDAEVQRLSQRTPVDSNPECLSPFGIYNMEGNVDELLINTHKNLSSHKNTLKGGHWIKGARNRTTPRTDAHNEDFAFYEVGARLCRDIR